MIFSALRRFERVAELVICNGGDHSLSRLARDHTLDVDNRMLGGFDTYLR